MISLDKSLFDEWRACEAEYEENIKNIFLDNEAGYRFENDRIVTGSMGLDQYKSEFPIRIEKLIQVQSGQLEKVITSKLGAWLTNESGFNRAYKLLSKRHGSSDYVDRLKNRTIQEIAACESAFDVFGVLEKLCALFKGEKYWKFRFVKVLEGYLFLDHDAIFKSKKTLASNAERLRVITKEIDPYMSSIGVKSHSLDAAIRRLETFAPFENELRNSQFKAEQYFVREMCRINKHFFRVPKPEIISELMTISCFRHSYDTRHIAKVCSQIALAQSQRKSRKDAMAELRYAES